MYYHATANTRKEKDNSADWLIFLHINPFCPSCLTYENREEKLSHRDVQDGRCEIQKPIWGHRE